MERHDVQHALEELVRNPRVEDIVLNPKGIFSYQQGSWHGPHGTIALGKLKEWSRKIAEHSGQTLGLTSPTVDAFLPFSDELCFRAHIAIAPLVLEGPVITLRRLPQLQAYRLRDFGMSPKTEEILSAAIVCGSSILIAGKTGSGKTSLLTSLLAQVPATQRVLILEDSPEIPLPNTLSSKLLCRNDRFGFRSGAHWDLSHLVFESLRMRPDRLVLGECRGREAYAIAQALQTGHRGLLATIHAGSCRQAKDRFLELLRSHPDHSDLKIESLWDHVLYLEEDESGLRCLREHFSNVS